MKFIHSTRKRFLDYISDKRIVMFGASKQPIDAWEDFYVNFGVDISGQVDFVVDNDRTKNGSFLLLGNTKVGICETAELNKAVWENKVILITSRGYLDILRQLEEIAALENVEVFAYACIVLDREQTVEERYKVRVLEAAMQQYSYYQAAFLGDTSKKKEAYDSLKNQIESDGYRVLPRIVLMHSNICNLKCKYCCDLISQSKSHYFIPAKDMIRDFEIILKGVDKVMCVDLTDGETFLYRELDTMLEYLMGQDKVETIMLFSNGTVMPSEKVLKLLSNSKAWVSFSDYKTGDQLEQILTEMEKYNIKHTVARDQRWKDMKLDAHEKRTEGRDLLMYEFLRCGNKLCSKAYIHRKLYACMPAFRMSYMGYYQSGKDYVEFFEDDSADDIWKKLYHVCMIDYIEACDYCNFENTGLDYIEPGT